MAKSPKVFAFEFCKVIRVIDGDTVVASVDLGFHTWHEDKFRLAGIDAVELKEPLGPTARDLVTDWLSHREVRLLCHGLDKYGRWLAHFQDKNDPLEPSLNQALIIAGLAVPMK